MSAAVVGLVAAYLVLATLLLSLNLTSSWRWWVKGFAILVTTGFFGVTYHAVNGMTGWPTTQKLPPRFNIVWTRIVEPSKKNNDLGGIFIWAEELDANNVPASKPRSYQLPYTDAAARKVAHAQEKRDKGAEVMGRFDDQAGRDDVSGKTIKMGKIQQEGEQNAAVDTVPFREDDASLSFEDMPPVILPDKGPL